MPATFSILHRDGRAEADPQGQWMSALLGELEPVEGEQPGVAVRHRSGWTLSAFPTGLVAWQNTELGRPERRAFFSIDQLRLAFEHVARGEVELVDDLLDEVAASATKRINEIAAHLEELGA